MNARHPPKQPDGSAICLLLFGVTAAGRRMPSAGSLDTSRLRFDGDSQYLDLSSMALKSQHPALWMFLGDLSCCQHGRRRIRRALRPTANRSDDLSRRLLYASERFSQGVHGSLIELNVIGTVCGRVDPEGTAHGVGDGFGLGLQNLSSGVLPAVGSLVHQFVGKLVDQHGKPFWLWQTR